MIIVLLIMLNISMNFKGETADSRDSEFLEIQKESREYGGIPGIRWESREYDGNPGNPMRIPGISGIRNPPFSPLNLALKFCLK
jgi:hypothetical protein